MSECPMRVCAVLRSTPPSDEGGDGGTAQVVEADPLKPHRARHAGNHTRRRQFT